MKNMRVRRTPKMRSADLALRRLGAPPGTKKSGKRNINDRIIRELVLWAWGMEKAR
ncbi:MAG: hypothetical protein AAB695_01105 [Patescibacteria group bacterium]